MRRVRPDKGWSSLQQMKGSNHVSLLLDSFADLRKGAGSSSAVRVINREPNGKRQPGGYLTGDAVNWRKAWTERKNASSSLN